MEPSNLTSVRFRKYIHFLYLEPDYLNPNDFIKLYIYFTQEGDVKPLEFQTDIVEGKVFTKDLR